MTRSPSTMSDVPQEGHDIGDAAHNATESIAPERTALQAAIDSTQRNVTGTVRMDLYKGNVIVAGRKSPHSLYLQDLASFGASSYDHGDATGFINLFGLATGVAAIVHRGIEEDTGQAPEIKGMAGFHEK